MASPLRNSSPKTPRGRRLDSSSFSHLVGFPQLLIFGEVRLKCEFREVELDPATFPAAVAGMHSLDFLECFSYNGLDIFGQFLVAESGFCGLEA